MISRKKLFIISLTIVIMAFLSTILGFSDTNFKPKYGISTTNVNLRKTANLSYSSIIKQIPQNTNFKIIGELSNFYIIQLATNQVGLISKDYSKIEGTNLNESLIYENLKKFRATINNDLTNIRSGPSTSFQSYGKLYKNDIVEVIGKIENFYMIITKDNTVGMIREDLLTKVSENQENIKENAIQNVSNEQFVLNLINEARIKNNIAPLSIDDLLQKTAQNKANDMVTNNYFEHNSSTYGTPFNMMKNAGIKYKTAGENIAGNPHLEDAVKSWLNSEIHKKNILSSAYNFTGIGIKKSDKYGYVIVAMFIGR